MKQKVQQLTINYKSGLTDAYATCREYVQDRVHKQGRPQKSVAADMDYSPSHLSRKLAQSPDDSMRFTLDDFESFMDVTGDTSPVLYLVEKYLTTRDRIAELEAEIDRLRGEG